MDKTKSIRIEVAHASDIMPFEDFKRHRDHIMDYFEENNLSLRQVMFILYCTKMELEVVSGCVMTSNSEIVGGK